MSLALLCSSAAAQELAPRAYWPAPKGTNVLGIGYGYTDGDVLTDPAIPVDGVDNETHSLAASFYRSFSLAGRTAGLAITLPGARSRITAALNSGEESRTISGASDLQLRLGINLVGGPAMTPLQFREFLEAPPPRLLGASIKLQLPTGEYNNDRVANIGASRWAVKPEIGYIEGLGDRSRWGLETALGIWIYGDNDNSLGDLLEQEPMLSAEVHLVRLLAGGRWFSFDFNYYQGGQTTRAGAVKDNRQQNSRYGATFALPIKKRHQIRAAFSDSLRIEEGGDYLAVGLSYSYIWRSQ